MSRESYSSQKHEYQALMNELNKQVIQNQPEDVLQFCFNFFLQRLNNERSKVRDQTHWTQDVITHPSDSFMRETTPMITTTEPDEEEEEENDSVSQDLPQFISTGFPKNRRVSVSAESMQPSLSNQSKKKKKGLQKKPEAEADLIAHSLQNHFLFRTVEQEQLQDVIDSMEEKRFKAGSFVIEQGAVGDYFYIVSEGTLDCFVDDKKVTEYHRGGSFGELALMYNAPRAATIQATSDAILWALDRISFRSMLMETNAEKRQLHEKFLEYVPLLKSLELAERHKIADALEPVWFHDGDVVLRQGDPGESFYLIEKGTAVCYYQKPGFDTQEQVNELKKELALIHDKPRAATVVAKGDLKCVTLGKAAFIRLLGPVMDILKRNTANYHAILQQADQA
ncbi:cAMP-dependent protein kinase regulatory subunit [Choanephora cucurbitarum]|uniref:cAMP-dependent protein kinase regulatory subunit n=1 Tax=Choanephora cucurbitarum TaxID=101091 RepID=A0A1C7N5R3_9FUNG|nr:cAMP-dependent protein kinase regulatory subunit [Choanephora cucurbitarum]